MLLSIIILPIFSQSRNTAIELHIDDYKLSQTELDTLTKYYDIEYSSKEQSYILWVHLNSDYKPFSKDLFQHMNALKKAYNRYTKTDHLNLYIESDSIDEYGKKIDLIKYKNIKSTELFFEDFDKIKTKKELEILTDSII